MHHEPPPRTTAAVPPLPVRRRPGRRLAGILFIAAALTASPVFAQGAMTNGENHAGSISAAGEVDTWTFTASQNDRIAISIGEVLPGGSDPGFWPWIRLLNPSGQQLNSDFGALVGQIFQSAPVSGTYTVLVASNDSGHDNTGSYKLTLAKTPGSFIVPPGDEGGPMTNGENHAGALHLGDLDQWTFTAAQNDRIILSIGEVFLGETDPGFWPSIQLISPTGQQLALDWGELVAQISLAAPLTGTYTVVVNTEDSGSDNPGSYRLTLAKAPGSFIVPPGDHGGAMTNGENHAGALHLGDLDQWTFTAAQNDRIILSIGEVFLGETDPGFWPSIQLISPTGQQLALDWGELVAQISLTAPLTGTYTVVVNTEDSGSDNPGSYRLTLAKAPGSFIVPPGDHGGAMTNGENHAGALHLGDLDQWTFTAAQNDRIILSIGEVFLGETDPGFWPSIQLISPTGQQLALDWGELVAQISLTAPLTGTYTVVVNTEDSGSDNPGSYRLTLAKAPGSFIVPPGDHGGAMTNGENHAGALHLGDLDQWTFTAAQNDRIVLSIGEVFLSEMDPGFWPSIQLIGPTGQQLALDWGELVAQISLTAPLTGTYTVVVNTEDSGSDNPGSYRLTLAKAPGTFVVPVGDEGGGMTNDVNHAGVIHLGDLDQWRFSASQGVNLTLTITEVQVGETNPGFWPWIRLIGPTGTLVASNWGDTTAQINVVAPSSGAYRVVVSTNNSGNDATGNYVLKIIGANPGFSEEGIQGGLTVIKAVHITELRSRIDALRVRFGLGAYAWTDSSLLGVIAKSVHVTELRTALVAAYIAAGRTPPGFTDGTLTATQVVIKAVHILELREAVLALE